ncbi:rhomboid family intramembrane serine protease [Sulfitobacter aestuariivivens]|uniref:Rhomboid family intramembrane serine protease n=1 Tax=Sulfitobacter aestuariivivens TaxID=2766981 RepID=A0A927D1W0_9RHOB|nr:rhomboid family intramembrane serine protease [Sulfitobacter aestuariivivens]MBD3662818.1 rhomboid family intramembrane serine protease [Sulfitobacter aestuariivivens]
MFPIRDHNPSGRTPYVTYVLMVLNIVIFLSYFWRLSDPVLEYEFYNTWALVPIRLANGVDLHTLFTSMFLHGGWLHLAGNMLFLYIFGDNIEEELGHVMYLLFYLACGVLAGLAQVITAPLSQVPMVGASGAIAGVMGAYLLLFPKAKVDIFVFFIVFFRIFPIPAWIMLMLWLGMQFLGGAAANPDEGGVAYWAHAGGFVAGMLLAIPFWMRRGATAYWERTEGHPPHPAATYPVIESRIPRVKRK